MDTMKLMDSTLSTQFLNICPLRSPTDSAITVNEDRSRIPILLLLLPSLTYVLFLKHQDSSKFFVIWSKWFMSVFSHSQILDFPGELIDRSGTDSMKKALLRSS